ncbi:hypothetical protein C2845_PM17G02240 [Panicum miliaceum]|uniref:Protein kinase domain-containing protein n=1 Tax=Panicum miliaceum TaxID=4540 RepID=A0A3L6Q3P6_PANMI|nr:hypothetical protein C2845_PM17G02240 [Panicum miliaceum]
MEREASIHDLLERILLNESEEPTNLPIWLLESITNNFSDDQKIGSGGFADVYKGLFQNSIVAVKKLKLSARVELDETKFNKEVNSLMKIPSIGSSDFASSTLLDIFPLEPRFPFEPNERIECPVTLTNRTDHHVGIWIVLNCPDTCSSLGGVPYLWEQELEEEEDLVSSFFLPVGATFH